MTHTVLDVVQPVATAKSHVARGVRAERVASRPGLRHYWLALENLCRVNIQEEGVNNKEI